MTPRTQALAFRIWAYAEPLGWNCTFAEVAEALGVSTDRARRVAQVKGWLSRFRTTQSDQSGNWIAAGVHNWTAHAPQSVKSRDIGIRLDGGDE